MWTSAHQAAQAAARQRTGKHISTSSGKKGFSVCALSFDRKGRATVSEKYAENINADQALQILKGL